jgi:hypothetical protein
MFGYYQVGCHLASEYLEEVSTLFKAEKYTNLPRTECVMHVRKGDFSPNLVLLDSYYAKALDLVPKHAELRIIAERDVDLTNIITATSGRTVSVQTRTAEEDFFVMLHCDYLIMSNSTFCYWAYRVGDPRLAVYPDRVSDNEPWPYIMSGENSKSVKSRFVSEVK